MAEQLAQRLWNPWLLAAFLLVGGYFTLRSGAFQLRGWRSWLGETLGSLGRDDGRSGRGLSPLKTITTALGSTVGTGSIAGVATAIFFGGPGAVFWIWISALLGMMTAFVEKGLAVRYRRRDAAGQWRGGPMYYMEDGLGWRLAPRIFAAACIFAALTGGGLVQANSIAGAAREALGLNPLMVGAVLAAVTGVTLAGGLGRIAGLCQMLVPAMAALFLGGGGVVILCHLPALPGVLWEIVSCAFQPSALPAGCAGYGISAALRYGVARGVFTNEAGVGSSAIAHAAADTGSAGRQGLWGMCEVFLATLVICTVTALTILLSGVYDQETALTAIRAGTLEDQRLGAPMTMAAFAAVWGQWGALLVVLCLTLFAFTSILGWSYYGEQALEYLTPGRGARRCYRLAFLAAVWLGCLGRVEEVWALSDIGTALMALPNLAALLCLSREGLELLKSVKQRPGRGRRWA